MNLTTYIRQVPILRMSGSVLLLTLYFFRHAFYRTCGHCWKALFGGTEFFLTRNCKLNSGGCCRV
jgi:hypothetical protein